VVSTCNRWVLQGGCGHCYLPKQPLESKRVARVEVQMLCLCALYVDNDPAVRRMTATCHVWLCGMLAAACVHRSIPPCMHTAHVSVVISKHGEPVRLLRVLRTTRSNICNARLGGHVGTLWFAQAVKAAGRCVLHCISGWSRCLDANGDRARKMSSPHSLKDALLLATRGNQTVR
jgi:hypothetical protein